MEIKITVKYHIEVGEEIIECDSLEKAERKIKSMRKSEIYCHLYKTVFTGKSIKEVFLLT